MHCAVGAPADEPQAPDSHANAHKKIPVHAPRLHSITKQTCAVVAQVHLMLRTNAGRKTNMARNRPQRCERHARADGRGSKRAATHHSDSERWRSQDTCALTEGVGARTGQGKEPLTCKDTFSTNRSISFVLQNFTDRHPHVTKKVPSGLYDIACAFDTLAVAMATVYALFHNQTITTGSWACPSETTAHETYVPQKPSSSVRGRFYFAIVGTSYTPVEESIRYLLFGDQQI